MADITGANDPNCTWIEADLIEMNSFEATGRWSCQGPPAGFSKQRNRLERGRLVDCKLCVELRLNKANAVYHLLCSGSS